MIKRKFWTVLIIMVSFLGICGCNEPADDTNEKSDLELAVESFANEDSYEFDQQLISEWKSDSKTKVLEESYENYPEQVNFIRANIALYDADDDMAYSLFDKCIEEADPNEDTDIVAKSMYEKAKKIARDGDCKKANKLIDKIQNLYEGKDNRDLNIRINVLWAYDLLEFDDGVPLSVKLMIKTRELAIDYNFEDIEYVLYQLAASCTYDGNMKEANRYYTEALKSAKDKNDNYWITALSIEVGINYSTLEDYDKALEYFNDAFEAVEDSTIDKTDALIKKVYLNNQCALSYIGLEDLNRAKEMLDEEFKLINQEKDGRRKLDDLANYYCSLGLYYVNKEEYKKGIKYYDKAMECYGDGIDSFYSGLDTYIYQCYGSTYTEMGEYDKALEYYKKTETKNEASGNNSFDLQYIDELYKLYCKKGDYKTAVKYADRRIKILEDKYEAQEEKNEDYVLEQLKANEKEAEIKRLKEKNKYLDIMNIFGLGLIVLAIVFVANMINKNKKIKKLNEQLIRTSNVDALTGLNNRRALTTYFDQEWNKINETGSSVSMVMLDIDFFKKYNDFYGHQAGDAVITKISEAIMVMCRKNDFAARYGGEEFLIILPDTTKEETVRIFEQLQDCIKAEHIQHSKSEVSEYVTISVGCATVSRPVEYLEVIRTADEMLYEAKKKRNCICSIDM